MGDAITLRHGPATRTLTVRGISDKRGGAPQAQLMYEETEASLKLRSELAEQRQLEPASSHEHGRPTKRDRRSLDKVSKANNTSWGSRWSAPAD